MKKKEPISWSVSRSRSFNGCLRAHWFTYHDQERGQRPSARLLKRLVTYEMLAGQVVDWQVDRALKEYRSCGDFPQNLAELGLDAWENLILASKGAVLDIKNGRELVFGAQPLLSDYYPFMADEKRYEHSRRRISDSLQGFTKSEALIKLLQISTQRWSPVREAGQIGAVEWSVSGVKVWSAIDFWMVWDDGIVILDWKSSRLADSFEGLQLATYALWAINSKKIPMNRILVQAVHLPLAPEWQPRRVSDVELQSAVNLIVDENILENQLLSTSKERIGEEANNNSSFPPRPAQEFCAQCRFLAICSAGREFLGVSIPE